MDNKIVNKILITVFIFSLINCSKENVQMQIEAKDTIKKVIEEAYINGIHRTQDINLVRNGFNKDFNMLVLQDNKIDKIDIDEWMKRLEIMKNDSPELWNAKTTCKFDLVDVSGYSAVAKLDVFKGKIHFSTDFMLLYKFDDGWEIVSKIFSIPQN